MKIACGMLMTEMNKNCDGSRLVCKERLNTIQRSFFVKISIEF